MNARLPALFLDRDGVINEEVGYLSRADDVRLVPGIVAVIRRARELGYRIVVITNQAGIGRGFYTEDDFHAVMRHLRSLLAADGADLDAVYFSPYHPVHGLGQYQRETECRKPAPGMLLRAAEEHGLDLSRSLLIGDRWTDIAAGAVAGVPVRLLLNGTEDPTLSPSTPHSALRIDSLTEALPYLVAQELN